MLQIPVKLVLVIMHGIRFYSLQHNIFFDKCYSMGIFLNFKDGQSHLKVVCLFLLKHSFPWRAGEGGKSTYPLVSFTTGR